jgi:hypothetical protein
MVAQPDPPRQPQEPWPNLRARPRSFFNAPLCDDIDTLEADVAFIGIPFDQGTLGRPGARSAPTPSAMHPAPTRTPTPTALRE